VIITVTIPIMYGLENILFEKPEKRINIVDWWTLLDSLWVLILGIWILEKSYSFKERLEVIIGIYNKENKLVKMLILSYINIKLKKIEWLIS